MAVALRTKGGHTPKAGPKKRTAKSEAEAIRRAVAENTTRIKPARKTSRVRTYTYKRRSTGPTKRALDAVERELALRYQMRTPQPLSLGAQWMELKPAGFHLWDWWLMFDTDKELWPFIIELVEEGYVT
jgi:hypothetical protein